MPEHQKIKKIVWEFVPTPDAKEHLAQAFCILFKKMGEGERLSVGDKDKETGNSSRYKKDRGL